MRFSAIMLIGILVFATFSAAEPAQAPADPAGFQFQDHLIVLLVKAVAPGTGSVDIDQDLVLLAKELKSAPEAKRVNGFFAVRYSRLLSAVRQAVLKDTEFLYWPMHRFNMIDFIEERTGQMPEWDKLLFIVNDHGGSEGWRSCRTQSYPKSSAFIFTSRTWPEGRRSSRAIWRKA